MLVCALPPSETHAVLQSQSSFSLNTSAFLGTSSIKLAGFTVSTATLQWVPFWSNNGFTKFCFTSNLSISGL